MLRRIATPENNAKGRALISFQAHTSRPPAVDFFARATSCRSPPSKPGEVKHRLLRKNGDNEIQELILRDQWVTRPAKVRHPCLPVLSINAMRFNQNPRSLSNLFHHDKKRRRENKIQPKPCTGSRPQILTQPTSPSLKTRVSTRHHHLSDARIEVHQCTKNSLKEAIFRSR